MNISDIIKMPTVIKAPGAYEPVPTGGWPESLLRAYHILALVKRLVAANTEPKTILEIVDFIENAKSDTEGTIERCAAIADVLAGTSMSDEERLHYRVCAKKIRELK